jgi:anti-sigma regulatory factor (Ser/Thr protein kinase)
MTAAVKTDRIAYQHEAVFYAGAENFLNTVLPFVLDGLAADEPVMVAASAAKVDILRTALGRDAGVAAVHFLDLQELGRNPGRMIAAWHSFVYERSRARPGRSAMIRGLGEPVWHGGHENQVVESRLHEALLNIAIRPDVPFWLRCPYDVDTLPAELVEDARRNHPSLVVGGDTVPSDGFTNSAYQDVLRVALPTRPDTALSLVFGRDSDAEIRDFIARNARAVGLDENTVADLVLAVYELATNSVRHAGGRGVIRTWVWDDRFVCEVVDQGVITDPLIGRIPPLPTATGGRGVWIANQLCDLVQVRSTASGTCVRVTTWLD